MSDPYTTISPFALSDDTDGPPFTNANATTTITEVKVPTIICLSGNPMDEDLPAPNIVHILSDSRKIMAVAPDQWLISDTDKLPAVLLNELQQQYSKKTVVCANHSHAWTILRVSGTGAVRCLSRLCSVDIHPQVFSEHDLIQTNMAGIYILCMRTRGNNNSFDLYMSHSFSRSFFKILRDVVSLD